MDKILFASYIALWIVMIVQALFLLALFRYVGLLLERFPPEGPPLGQKAPRHEIKNIQGKRHVLGDTSKRGRVLIFTSPSCPWCEKLAPEIAPFARSVGSNYEVFVIITARLEDTEARSYAEGLGQEPSLRVALGPELVEAYHIAGTPYGLVLDQKGIVRRKGVTNNLTDLQTSADTC